MRRTRNRLSRTLLLAGLAAAAAASVAAATPLGEIANAQIASAGSGVPRCDTNGITVAYTTSGSSIVAVVVASRPGADCEGAVLRVTITDANGNSIAQSDPQIVLPDADSVAGTTTLPLDAKPVLEDAAGVEISVVGI